jgi:hypothetical protein
MFRQEGVDGGIEPGGVLVGAHLTSLALPTPLLAFGRAALAR